MDSQNLNYSSHWWEEKEKDVYKSVNGFIKTIENDQNYREVDNTRHARLYGNYEISGLHSQSTAGVSQSTLNTTHRVTLNVIQSIIDTVVSKITKNKPKPMFLTSGGDWSTQQKAKKLTKFCEGIFQSCDLYDESAKAFLDSCIFGTGAVKFFIEDGEIKSERVFINELKIDDVDGYYGKPRQLHQIKFLHKSVLKNMFPEKTIEIDKAAKDDSKFKANRNGVYQDMVRVVESWHLRSGKKAKDGKHSLSISNCTLMVEEWNKEKYPFVFFRWGQKPVGFFGQGIAEQLQGIQLEINKLLRVIQVSMHLVSIPKIFIDASSKIVSAHLNNKVGGIIKYSGQKPENGALAQIPQELFLQVDRLYNKAFEIAGVSQLSSMAVKPSGLNSGKALRTFNDIETERFYSVGRRYEKAFIDATAIIIDFAKEIYEEDNSFKAVVTNKKFAQTIKWSEVSMKDDEFVMEVFPISALSNHPSARFQEIEELMTAGLLSPKQGKRLLDFPDLEAVMNLENAAEDDIQAMIENMVENGKYESPEPYQDLRLGIEKCQQAYLYFRRQKAPESRLELLRQWIEDANTLVEKAAQKQESAAMQQQQAVENAQMLAAQGAESAAAQVLENADTPEEETPTLEAQ